MQRTTHRYQSPESMTPGGTHRSRSGVGISCKGESRSSLSVPYGTGVRPRPPVTERSGLDYRSLPTLVEQQARIEQDLEAFRIETYPRKEGLTSEVRLILNHVHRHLFDLNLNVEQVKLSCRIRDNNVSSRFRHALGLSIKAYIETLRMEAAERLLKRRKIGVFDVAQFVGYNHLQTFYRAFQRRFGCPPATYRRRYLTSVGR